MSCARLIREVGPASGSGFGASLARPAGTRHRRALYTFSRAPAASVSYDVFRIFDQNVFKPRRLLSSLLLTANMCTTKEALVKLTFENGMQWMGREKLSCAAVPSDSVMVDERNPL